jgi:nucleoside 2-deoxyribosyltransferase
MKIYVAGKIRNHEERSLVEEVASLCESLGFETFVPHRDVGLVKGIEDVDRIFEGDITNGFKDVSLVVAVLEGLHVGAGTAWELGYAYARGIPAIGLKMDEPASDGLEYLSAILLGSMRVVASMDELRTELEKRKI